MTKKSSRRLLEIRWVDVSSFDGWRSISEASESCKPFSARMVGWEIRRTSDFILLATALSGNECNGRRVIPLGCVKKIRELEGPR